MNDLHVYANGDQTTAVAAEMRAEIQRLTAERDEAREACTTWLDSAIAIQKQRDEARARSDRLSDLLARERLLHDLLLAEVREMRATWRQG